MADFGEVVLWCWLEAAAALLGKATVVRLRFMDGPYELIGHYDRGRGVVRFSAPELPSDWVVPVAAFVEELIAAARAAINGLGQLGIASRLYITAGLETALRRLRQDA